MSSDREYDAVRGGLLKGHHVVFRPECAPVPAGHLPRRRREAPPDSEPRVTVVRARDGSVKTITVRCTCGREITLHCDYAAEGDQR